MGTILSPPIRLLENSSSVLVIAEFAETASMMCIEELPRSTMGREPSRESPIEILKRREKEEYERKWADLRH